MKTIILFLMMFAFVPTVEAGKRVPINKVIKAIEDDSEKALKDYKDFESKFAVENISYADAKRRGVIKNTEQKVNMGNEDVKEGKKYHFSCTLEKYDDNGAQKVRIKVIKNLSK